MLPSPLPRWSGVEARRLKLAGLDPLAKALAAAGLGVLISAAAVAVLYGLGWTIPGGTDEVSLYSGTISEVPRAATVLAYLALGVGAAIAVAAAAGLPGPWEWAVRMAVGLVGAAIAGLELQAARVLDAFPLGVGTVGTLAHVFGWIAVVGAATVAFTPPPYARRLQPLMIGAGGSPALLAGSLYVIWPNVAGPPGTFGVSSHGILAIGILSIIGPLGIVVSIYVLWQAIVGIEASRSGAMRLARTIEGRPLFWLGGILAVKLAWLGCGYAGILPPALGGDSSSWADSRHDGILSWLLAIIFAGATCLAFARLPLQRIDERGSRPVMAGLAAIFSAFFVLGGILLLLYGALGIFASEGGLKSVLIEVIVWLNEGLLWSTVVGVFAASALALGLAMFRRSWVGLPFLLVVAIWALPRALQATPSLDDEPFRHLAVSVTTFDAVLSVGIAMLFIAWQRNWQRSLPPVELALIVGVSTLVAATPTLLSGVDDKAYFYVALLFPAAYLFLFDARSLNRPDPARRRRVLAATGGASVLLALVSLQIILGTAGPGHSSQAQIVQAVMAVPIAGVLTAAALATLRAES